ncbi:MAG: ribonuclease III [Patescibacteria group bacterium]|nr:ribonuclease III [Patescibacteria group bacterium]
MASDSSKLEQKLGIQFKDKNLLKEALTHRSYLNEYPGASVSHNERLEYLGDAVLELITTEHLFRTYPDYQEGRLTSLRAALVNYQMLSRVAREIDLENYLLLSRGESKDVGRARDAILANALEALIGAFYIDQGYESTRALIKEIVLKHLGEVIEQELYRDPKSTLQEVVQQKLKITPTYKVLKEQGPDHKREFLVGVFFGDELKAQGPGASKQEAELEAAKAALAALKNHA